MLDRTSPGLAITHTHIHMQMHAHMRTHTYPRCMYRVVLACISRSEDGRYTLEDHSGSVPFNLSEAETAAGFFTGGPRAWFSTSCLSCALQVCLACPCAALACNKCLPVYHVVRCVGATEDACFQHARAYAATTIGVSGCTRLICVPVCS